MATPLDIACPHIESHGFHCGADPGDPCVTLDRKGNWNRIEGYHLDRILISKKRAPVSFDQLTPAERKVVTLLIDGHNQESISSRLAISIETVKRHMQNIYGKLGYNSNIEVVAFYYQTYWRPNEI